MSFLPDSADWEFNRGLGSPQLNVSGDARADACFLAALAENGLLAGERASPGGERRARDDSQRSAVDLPRRGTTLAGSLPPPVLPNCFRPM